MELKDIMTRDVITVSPNMTLRAAVQLLFKLKISGLPVVNEKSEVIGMITEKEIIAMSLPNYIEQVGDFAYMLDSEPFRNKFGDIDKILVKDVMRKDVVTVSIDTPVAEVARSMLSQKARRMPVLDKNKKMAGMIARADIVREIAKQTGIVE